MKSIALALLLALGPAAAEAAPVAFTSQTYTTFGLADSGGAMDGPFNQDSSSSALPFGVSAGVAGAEGSASATALADTLFLSADTDATAATGPASATAVATFTGHFTASGGFLSLRLDFASLGSAGADLFVTLDVGGSTLFDRHYVSTGLVDETLAVPAPLMGAAGLLDITLASLSDAASPGDALANSASVRFSLNTVPEPGPWADLLLGSGLLILARRPKAPRGPR
jgi:hypothetical protein